MVETARLLALVNLGMADAIIGCWDAKYTYSSWRPITAITLGDTDGNNATAPDPGWTPLITTPAFPEYPSAHSCVSGAAGRILSEAFGEDTSFTVVSNAMPGYPRMFHSFSAASEEVKNARVFGGIHFRTACVDGEALGIAVARVRNGSCSGFFVRRFARQGALVYPSTCMRPVSTANRLGGPRAFRPAMRVRF